eukprot:gene12386-6053_t
MKTSLIILLLIIFCLFNLNTCSECDYFTDCKSCTYNNECVWCSMESECRNSNETCKVYPQHIFYTEKTHNPYLKENEHGWINLTQTCNNFKVIEKIEECPDFKLESLMTSSTRGMNLVLSLEQQPKIKILPIDNNTNWINETNLNYFTTILGYYITQSPRNDSYGFSFIHHTQIQFPLQSPYFIDETKRTIQFVDIALTGARGTHKIGYIVAIKRLNSSSIQCSFLPERKEIFLSMVYESFLSYIHVFGLILYGGTNAITLILVIICNGNYVDKIDFKDEYFEEQEEQEEQDSNKQDLEKKSLIKPKSYHNNFNDDFRKFRSGKKNSILDFLLTIFRISDSRDSQTIGTEAYFFLRYNRMMILVMFCFLLIGIPLFFIDWLTPADIIGGYDVSDLGISAITPDKSRSFWFSSNTPFLIFHFIAAFLFVIVTIIMNFFLLRLTRIYLPKKEEISQKQTIQISNVQITIKDENKIKNIFDEILKDEKDLILSINIAWELSSLNNIIENIENLNLKIKDLNENKRYRYYWFQIWLYKENDLKLKIKSIENLKNELVLKTLKFKNNNDICGTGYCFITFKNKEIIDYILKNWNDKEWKSNNLSSKSQILSMRWKLNKAEKSSNINWNNLHYSKFNQYLRIIFGTILLLFGFSIFGFISFFISFAGIIRSIFRFQISNFLSLFQQIFIAVKFFIDLSPFFIATMITTTIFLIQKFVKYSKYHSLLDENSARTKYFVFYMFMNTFLIPRILIFIIGLFVSFNSIDPFNTYDYLILKLTPTVMNVLTIIPFLMTTYGNFNILFHIFFDWLKHRKITRPNYSLNVSNGTLLVIFMYTFFMGPILPFILPFTFIYFIVKYFRMRILIFYYYKKSSDVDGVFLRYLTKSYSFLIFVFPIVFLSIMSRFLGALFIFTTLSLFILVIIISFLFPIIYNKCQKSDSILESRIKKKYSPVELDEIKNEYQHPLYSYFKGGLTKKFIESTNIN